MQELTNYRERKEPARHLRQDQTEAERVLWSRLRNRQLGGFKFRRQFPLGPFFADFCCMEQRLVVEVDGDQHAHTADEDSNRAHAMTELGFRVIRFWNNEALAHTDIVCKRILCEIENIPLPSGEGGEARVRQNDSSQ